MNNTKTVRFHHSLGYYVGNNYTDSNNFSVVYKIEHLSENLTDKNDVIYLSQLILSSISCGYSASATAQLTNRSDEGDYYLSETAINIYELSNFFSEKDKIKLVRWLLESV